MPHTTWVLCDQTGEVATEITNASTRVFRASRNLGRQGAITLSHTDVEAGYLFDILRGGTPQLRYYRRDAEGEKQLRLSAYLTAIQEGLDEDGESVLTATFKDPFGRMLGSGAGDDPGRVLLYPTATPAGGLDQGMIAWTLIGTLAQNESETGLRQGSIPATVKRDRAYEAGKNIGEAIVQLTEVLGGFDFEVLPLDPTAEDGKLGEFVVYASQGAERLDLLWGYGPGTMANVRKVERTIAPPINRVILTTSDGLTSTKTDALSIATYGEWAVSRAAANDVVLQETLDQAALDALRPAWVRTMKFEPDSTIGPQPFDDYWLGDTGRFMAREGAFEEAFVPRVTGVTITEHEEDDETHELETEVVAYA